MKTKIIIEKETSRIRGFLLERLKYASQEKMAFALFKKTIQHFAIFPKLIREMSFF